MEFEDCYTSDQKSLCKKLLNSFIHFQVHPHERKIRLALTPPINVKVSLNLTILHGPCTISCEGDINSCDIIPENDFWPDTTHPFYINNCIPSHNYCVTASIGECCPICTNSVFMEDNQKEYYDEEGWQWSTMMALVIILIIILLSFCFVAVLKNYFIRGHEYSRGNTQNMERQFTQHILDIENNRKSVQLVCFYLRESNQLYVDMVKSVQEFLRGKGINVIDIYDEEETINCSISNWVHNVLKKEKAKVLIFDSENIQQLWNGTMDRGRILKPLEQVIYFTRTYIPITNVHNYLFVVRFQDKDYDHERFVDLSDGRCYVYPIHRERLAGDIKL
ncbi:uncharacterized protein LOC128991125 [Macrosteles quadrilineatus]|uniref:uncharacterized protein LOC128991125 n=1 Tax=Macrosteles quadrilineatus TaxID=74068 RepID=UPI0023E12734|nr:uncharacterized protein LOC128991125 [Macrosteles quadrilineatus]